MYIRHILRSLARYFRRQKLKDEGVCVHYVRVNVERDPSHYGGQRVVWMFLEKRGRVEFFECNISVCISLGNIDEKCQKKEKKSNKNK